MRPILLSAGSGSVNHRLPSGPGVIRSGRPVNPPNSTMLPIVSTRPIWLTPFSANQSAPSGPGAMPDGFAAGVGIGKNVNTPAGVSLTTALFRSSVNQRFPSGPLAMPPGTILQGFAGSHGVNPVICPAVVILPMKKSGKPEGPVNHNAPSGPETMSS